jgi:hypothetical protein
MALGRWPFLTLAVVILASCGVDGEETPAIILVRARPGTDLAAFVRGRALFEKRATTVDDAARAHDGEGAAVRKAYLELSDADRESLLAFVMSL